MCEVCLMFWGLWDFWGCGCVFFLDRVRVLWWGLGMFVSRGDVGELVIYGFFGLLVCSESWGGFFWVMYFCRKSVSDKDFKGSFFCFEDLFLRYVCFVGERYFVFGWELK